MFDKQCEKEILTINLCELSYTHFPLQTLHIAFGLSYIPEWMAIKRDSTRCSLTRDDAGLRSVRSDKFFQLYILHELFYTHLWRRRVGLCAADGTRSGPVPDVCGKSLTILFFYLDEQVPRFLDNTAVKSRLSNNFNTLKL